ncbi:CbtA family protein [Roseivivax sp. CAU 1761]
MFSRLLTSALFAGAAAGLIAALLQLVFVQPVLLHAELYETGLLEHFGAGAPAAAVQPLPGPDLGRDGLTVLFTMLVYSGYALVLTALMSQAEARGARIDARSGLLWGAAGFVTVQLAPGFSLAPEVPGVAMVDLAARQVWWTATVLATGAGLAMLAFGRSWRVWLPALALLAAPHLWGAPQPAQFNGPVPTELGALFAARSLGVGLAAWIALGGFAGLFWQRGALPAAAPARG